MTNPSILLIDDDRLILATLCDGLEKAGFCTASVADAEQALAIIEVTPPDLAIVDIRMPGMSGIELAERLEALDIPFIVLTAYTEAHEVDAMVLHGAQSYLVKPIDLQRLIPVVRVALERARNQASLRHENAQLNQALQGDRSTSRAVGILMERHQLSSEMAFEKLRLYARSNRRKLAEVAGEIVSAGNLLNQLA